MTGHSFDCLCCPAPSQHHCRHCRSLECRSDPLLTGRSAPAAAAVPAVAGECAGAAGAWHYRWWCTVPLKTQLGTSTPRADFHLQWGPGSLAVKHRSGSWQCRHQSGSSSAGRWCRSTAAGNRNQNARPSWCRRRRSGTGTVSRTRPRPHRTVARTSPAYMRSEESDRLSRNSAQVGRSRGLHTR